MTDLVGSKIERKEDKKFLTGKGRYTADINLNNQSYAYFVRSPHARAKITKIDVSKAIKNYSPSKNESLLIPKAIAWKCHKLLEFACNNRAKYILRIRRQAKFSARPG